MQQKVVQWVDTSNVGSHTPGYENAENAKPKPHRVRWEDTSSSEGGHLWRTYADKQSASADLKATANQHRVCWADEACDANSKTSVDEKSASVGSKVKGVRWTDEVRGAGADSVPATVRGSLKQALGRSKAKEWLLSQPLEAPAPMETLREIAEKYTMIRIEEGAQKNTVKSELLQVLQILTGKDLSGGKGGSTKAAARNFDGAGDRSQKVKDQRRGQWADNTGDANSQEPEPEDEGLLNADVVATAREWLKWYSLHLFRSS